MTYQIIETNRSEESQSHVHRLYFQGPNTFSEPWHLPHCPPEQVKDIVYAPLSIKYSRSSFSASNFYAHCLCEILLVHVMH